jgi:hypothetical protein
METPVALKDEMIDATGTTGTDVPWNEPPLAKYLD